MGCKVLEKFLILFILFGFNFFYFGCDFVYYFIVYFIMVSCLVIIIIIY